MKQTRRSYIGRYGYLVIVACLKCEQGLRMQGVQCHATDILSQMSYIAGYFSLIVPRVTLAIWCVGPQRHSSLQRG